MSVTRPAAVQEETARIYLNMSLRPLHITSFRTPALRDSCREFYIQVKTLHLLWLSYSHVFLLLTGSLMSSVRSLQLPNATSSHHFPNCTPFILLLFFLFHLFISSFLLFLSSSSFSFPAPSFLLIHPLLLLLRSLFASSSSPFCLPFLCLSILVDCWQEPVGRHGLLVTVTVMQTPAWM